ncbi:hypothetical protein VE01_02621 [Pseudogymnoascus verrucosus]|uniref:Protein kinase domain-containing protein n=1 Tax=Pseudogymnoascus verrucosus TaxID=342668 RepID=A0A1B8GTL4_9PEZI|nr:uncharacterized protein VE01_02621 [Pseudogymnoascus verrucosus]OBT99172.1 hypothetical protein VE01_02621 [Pseudogymnoascus verrucosus]
MPLSPGQIIKGARASYRLLHPLKGKTVFKAEILQARDITQRWAVVKTATGSLERSALQREYQTYQNPFVAESPFIRSLHEGVGDMESLDAAPVDGVAPPCLVLEWMDTELRLISSSAFRSGELPKHVARQVLKALWVLYYIDSAHTDVNLNNILISNLNSPVPVVKLADLGMVTPEGFNSQRLQSLPCRAPEVWKNQGVSHASDIWSLGVTLVHWLLGKSIFGARDKRVEGLTEAYCIAKLERLVGPLGDLPEGLSVEAREEFRMAALLRDMDMPPPGKGKLIDVRPLREELEQLQDPVVPPGLIDFIESLIVVDMEKRPIAHDALKHPYLDISSESRNGVSVVAN